MADMDQDAMSLGKRLKHAWNAFTGKDQERLFQQDLGASYYTRPDRVRLRLGNERTILASILNRISMDAASIEIQHAKLDDKDRYVQSVNSGLNYCLNVESNIDQTARAFKQDMYMKMLDEGVVAVVPTVTSYNPMVTDSYDIRSFRTAKILDWYPEHVRVEIYNDKLGKKVEMILPKSTVAIMENPLYAVMNEPISTLKRLIHKLNLLDAADEQTLNGKLDLIIQLPYPIKTEMRRQEAEKRRKDIEAQLSTGNKYGIAYTDGTEKITQLNRTVENKLMDQIEYLTSTLYSQLGMTREVFEGTADERVMLNYITRTIEPLVATAADELNRKFLTKTARTQHQKIMYFNDIFKLATMDSIASAGSQLVATEVITKNELRQKMGYKPVDDQAADQLMNPYINPQNQNGVPMEGASEEAADSGTSLSEMKVSEIM